MVKNDSDIEAGKENGANPAWMLSDRNPGYYLIVIKQ